MKDLNISPEKMKEYLKKAEEYAEKWTEIGVSTEPTNHELAEKGVKQLYKNEGHKQPEIIWCKSPMAGALLYSLLQKWRSETPGKDFRNIREISTNEEILRLIWANSSDKFNIALRDKVYKSMAMPIARTLSTIANALHESINHNPITEDLGDLIWEHCIQEADHNLFENVRDKLWKPIWESTTELAKKNIEDNIAILMPEATKNTSYGQHDAAFIAFMEFMRDEVGLTGFEKLEPLSSITQSCGWWWPLRDLCILTERPIAMHIDDRGRLHSDTALALEYGDGWGIAAIHGIKVTPNIVLDPKSITCAEIDNERNSEIQRIMIEKYGLAKYVVDSGAEEIHRDIDSVGNPRVLYRKKLSRLKDFNVVQVKNSTPDDDGRWSDKIKEYSDFVGFKSVLPIKKDAVFRDYFLTVPPTIKTCHEAIAWTFGVDPKIYNPRIEA